MLTTGERARSRVVQVGEAVAEAGPEMEQRRGRLVGHAGIAVRGAGRAALEQAQDAAHAVDAVERGHEMHLGRAGIGEGDLDAARDQGAHEALGAVHSARRRFALRHTRPRPYNSREAVTGTWSEGRVQPRASRCTSTDRSVPARSSDTQV